MYLFISKFCANVKQQTNYFVQMQTTEPLNTGNGKNFKFYFSICCIVIGDCFFPCVYVSVCARFGFFSSLSLFGSGTHVCICRHSSFTKGKCLFVYIFFCFFFISISCIIDWAVFFCYCWWWWYHTSNQMIANIQYTCFCSFHKQFFLLNFHIYERWQQYRYTLWAQTLLPSGVKLLFLLYHFNSIYIFSFIYAKYRRIQNGIWIGFSSSPSTICLNTYIELMLKALLQQ